MIVHIKKSNADNTSFDLITRKPNEEDDVKKEKSQNHQDKKYTSNTKCM